MGEHTNDSGEHSQSDVDNASRTVRVRQIGRTLAHIGDSLNQEMRAQRIVQSSTAVLVLQLVNLRGIFMSFLIPVRVTQYEAGISFLVYVISFGASFIPVRNS